MDKLNEKTERSTTQMTIFTLDSTPDSTPSSKSFRHDAASYGFYTGFYTFQQKLPA
jgi:hypothetical protein